MINYHAIDYMIKQRQQLERKASAERRLINSACLDKSGSIDSLWSRLLKGLKAIVSERNKAGSYSNLASDQLLHNNGEKS